MFNATHPAADAVAEVLDLPEAIEIRGARTHNLRNLDVDVPRGQLVVISGVSGSGKSSLAFDTLFAEGQRRYIDSLSTFARTFLDQMERPEVDLIEGLQPTLAIDQHNTTDNPRSTVATVTEIYDYLRVLMARCGEAKCYNCGAVVRQQSPDQILDALVEEPERTKVMLLAPMVRGRKGAHQAVFEQIRQAGLVRARVDGEIYELDAVPTLDQRRNHDVEAVADRLVIRPGIRPRLAESVRLALRLGEGSLITLSQSPDEADQGWREQFFSTKFACLNCGISFAELEPRSFSFNSPYGACETCEGLGVVEQFDPELVVPDPELSLDEGAIRIWKAKNQPRKPIREVLEEFLVGRNIDTSRPFNKLTDKQRQDLLFGDGKSFPGVLTLLEDQLAMAKRETEQSQLLGLRGQLCCPACSGSRLRPEARSVRLSGRAIHEMTALTVTDALAFFGSVNLEGLQARIGGPLVDEVQRRLAFLHQVGLDYLTLDRAAVTLSGGEAQRIRLASSIGSGLVGVCYVLDEPSIGLHPRDNARLAAALRSLQEQGNSVVVVEHDEYFMRHADHLIDIGPGAGRHGGRVVSQGTLAEVSADLHSPTGAYLAGRETIPIPTSRRSVQDRPKLTLRGASEHNLQGVTAEFPLGVMICVTGVSGSGKSTLINGTLARALHRKLYGGGPAPGAYDKLIGAEHIERLVQVDQSPIGRTPRSNPATYTGVFDEIRKVFAGTRQAKLRGYKASRFSFNVRGGRCETCQGQGRQRVEMNFLPDLWVTCPDCQGKRFNRSTLAIKYREKSIADILEMPIEEAVEFFENFPTIHRLLRGLRDVGLGYLMLGQPSTTLSGGEAQRVKLATELGRSAASGNSLYVFDEPTTGLHFQDVRRLLDVFSQLVDAGNTVIVIEHHLDVMKVADWIIDLGPDGGTAGGQIVATGTPEQLAGLADNHTAAFLRSVLPDSL